MAQCCMQLSSRSGGGGKLCWSRLDAVLPGNSRLSAWMGHACSRAAQPQQLARHPLLPHPTAHSTRQPLGTTHLMTCMVGSTAGNSLMRGSALSATTWSTYSTASASASLMVTSRIFGCTSKNIWGEQGGAGAGAGLSQVVGTCGVHVEQACMAFAHGAGQGAASLMTVEVWHWRVGGWVERCAAGTAECTLLLNHAWHAAPTWRHGPGAEGGTLCR